MSILMTAPDGANVLDLDAARAARAEARAAAGEANPFIKVSAGYIEVRPEIDLLVIEDFNANRISAALERLLVDPADVPALLSAGLSSADLQGITEFVTGKTLGESLASTAS